MHPTDYDAFSQTLTATLQAHPRVRGLVFLGSTAKQSHQPDMWSDHDFFVVTDSGAQEWFRQHVTWLPDHENIVLTLRETAHGVKVLYRNGHILEYAAFDVDEISLAKANDYAVVFDEGGITAAMQAIATPGDTHTPYTATPQRDMGMFVCQLLVGAGRVARGEVISGQVFIRTHAVAHLLPLLAEALPATDKSQLDNLNVFRRFERVFPEVGAEINTAIAKEPIAAALGLLDIFERALNTADGYPADGVETARRVLTEMTEV